MLMCKLKCAIHIIGILLQNFVNLFHRNAEDKKSSANGDTSCVLESTSTDLRNSNQELATSMENTIDRTKSTVEASPKIQSTQSSKYRQTSLLATFKDIDDRIKLNQQTKSLDRQSNRNVHSVYGKSFDSLNIPSAHPGVFRASEKPAYQTQHFDSNIYAAKQRIAPKNIRNENSEYNYSSHDYGQNHRDSQNYSTINCNK